MPTHLPGRRSDDRDAGGRVPARGREIAARFLRLAFYLAILVTALAALVSLMRSQGGLKLSGPTPPAMTPRVGPGIDLRRFRYLRTNLTFGFC